jgi:hypothetical protein
MKMDYVVVTFNDKLLHLTIDSIRRQPNVNRIIVVQAIRGPKEQQRMLQEMEAEGIIDMLLYESEGLAYARWLAIQKVETEFFVFVDGDVILNDIWFDVMEFYLDVTTSVLVLGKEFIVERPAVIFAVLARNAIHLAYLRKTETCVKEKYRMFTYDTIIKTDFVKDWEPPKDLHAFEDYHMAEHIRNKHGVIWRVNNPSLHLHQGSDFKSAAWNAAGARNVGLYKSWKDIVRVFFRTIAGGIKRTLDMNNDWFAIYATKCAFGYLYGYFRYKKFLEK